MHGLGEHLGRVRLRKRERWEESRVPHLSALKAPSRMHTVKATDQSPHNGEEKLLEVLVSILSSLLNMDPSNLSSGKSLSTPGTDFTKVLSRDYFHV